MKAEQNTATFENSIEPNYKLPAETKIGHIHLSVADLDRSLEFYHGLLGFEITCLYGDGAAFVSAGGYHHHIGLNTWQSKNAPPAKRSGVGLYHTAILYPTRKDLGVIYRRLLKAHYKIDGASDHGVSEAFYMRDPDNNGVELYWDKPKEVWPQDEKGGLVMYTVPIDLEKFLEETK